jgi:ATP-binding cassette subfamily B (MDR/TAP) protein 7
MGRTYRCRQKNKRDTSTLQAQSEIHHDLYKFLSAKGWTNENRLTVSSFPNTGRGLYAKHDLKENDLIIRLPLECLMSIFTLEHDDDFKSLFKEDELKIEKPVVSFQELLSFYLMYQKILNEKSQWKAYIDTIPLTYSVPYFCSKSELYFLSETILKKIVEQNNLIKTSYQILCELLQDVVKEQFTLDLFKWAYFVCNSRCVYIDPIGLDELTEEPLFKALLNDEATSALPPMLDLLNHSDDARTRCQLSQTNEFIKENAEKFKSGDLKIQYELYTQIARKKFDQIFVNYGAHNNTKLYIEYGFIIRNNQMDYLEITLEDINTFIKSHTELRLMNIPKQKYKFIRDHNLDEQMFIDPNDGINHSFQTVLCILLIPENFFNLTLVAFGGELDFERVKEYAIEIVRQKKVQIEKMSCALQSMENLSESAKVCVDYYEESIKLIDKVLDLYD